MAALKVDHLAVWTQLADIGNEYYQRALAVAGFRQWSGRGVPKTVSSCSFRSGAAGGEESSFYGETIVSPAYVAKHLPGLGFSVLLSTDAKLRPIPHRPRALSK